MKTTPRDREDRLDVESVLATLEEVDGLDDARDISRRLLALVDDVVRPRTAAISVLSSARDVFAAVGVLGYPHFTSTLLVSASDPALRDLLETGEVIRPDTPGRSFEMLMAISGQDASRTAPLERLAAGGAVVTVLPLRIAERLIGSLLLLTDGEHTDAASTDGDLILLAKVCALALDRSYGVSIYEESGRRSWLPLHEPAADPEHTASAGAADAGDASSVPPGPPDPPVTERQHQVLLLLAEGAANAAIAADLSISINTVRTHRRALMDLFDAHTSTELIARARRAGALD